MSKAVLLKKPRNKPFKLGLLIKFANVKSRCCVSVEMFNIRRHIVTLLDNHSNSVFSALNFRSNQELFICSLSSNIGNAFKKQTTFDIKIQLNGESWRTQTKKINRHNYLFINFFVSCSPGLAIILNFNISKVGCRL